VKPTVSDILNILEDMMPFALAEEWDNIGLLAGSRVWTVEKILCALDLTEEVVDEAVEKGCNLIVTHHPILFRGKKNLCEDDPEGRALAKLVRSKMALIAMHTNFDAADGGVNDVLAALVGLSNVEKLECGMRVGEVPATKLSDFVKTVEKALGGPVRAYGDPSKKIARVAVLGGSGGSYSDLARLANADAYLSGEVGYHTGLDNWAWGMASLEAGHAATERPAVAALKNGLQNRCFALQYNLDILESVIPSFL